jgi:hypothetical protein
VLETFCGEEFGFFEGVDVVVGTGGTDEFGWTTAVSTIANPIHHHNETSRIGFSCPDPGPPHESIDPRAEGAKKALPSARSSSSMKVSDGGQGRSEGHRHFCAIGRNRDDWLNHGFFRRAPHTIRGERSQMLCLFGGPAP